MALEEATTPGRQVAEANSSKVVIIGAGIAGIATAILLQNKVPNLTYTVVERNAGFVSGPRPSYGQRSF